ncbi:ABC transporter ATP-binding protein [uncultured Propionibacterium sp.]|uniref:ABC transporter ATP-binding protein n=1 Tax=uncultured Propionibacterium sp. TaxID=218066 RepID=UPI0029300465|nr:ABC transporter ATP-binding protein [uncultured Propionibacterium sp.]
MVLVAEHLTARYARSTVLDDVDFTVEAGHVAGLVGPNGAGKTTVLKCLAGLVSPAAGRALVDGRRCRDHAAPMRHLGVAYGPEGWYGGRTGWQNLMAFPIAGGAPRPRVDECIEQVGLGDERGKRVSSYSPGMRQRLSLAAILLGDSDNLILDEPLNGLDPEGPGGCAVLVSSHLLAELESLIDTVVLLDKGRVRACGPLTGLAWRSGGVLIRASSPDEVQALAAARGWRTRPGEEHGSIVIAGAGIAEVNRAVLDAGLEFSQIRAVGASLEDIFFRVTASSDQASSGTDDCAGPS